MKGVYVGEYCISKFVISWCFVFFGYFEGKVVKWGEDIVKVRVEVCFLEVEWEDVCWILCYVRMLDNNFGLYVVIF